MASTDPDGFIAELIRRRADPPVTLPVAREVTRDLPNHEKAVVLFAFVNGERGNPKAIRAAVSGTWNGIAEKLLESMQNATLPSSPPSTESPTLTPSPATSPAP